MMKTRPEAHELAAAAAPILAAMLLLATAPLWQPWLAVPRAASSWWMLALFVVASVAALYAPAGRQTVGLGALALPSAIWFFGVAWAGWLAAGAYLARELLRGYLLEGPSRRQTSVELLPVFNDAARLALATVAGGCVWIVGAPAGQGPMDRARFAVAGLLAGSTYAMLLLALHAIENRRLGVRPRPPAATIRSVLLDLGGWLLGGFGLRAVLALGWSESILLLAGVALLAAEAARNHYLRRRAVARVGELWEVTRAGHRIIFRDPDLASMAGHLLEECLRVMPFHWFQFELLQGDEGVTSWWAGPDGHIEEGVPAPTDGPPALPGIHRRSSWKVLERPLEADDELIGRLRFWCDPRRVESTSIELLDSLLPQVAASVHRALLDRRAKQDPLTGLADRRVLESRLEKVFAATHEDGGSMAVIMCDLDRFKKINDAHGHNVGDQALLRVVQILEEHRRDADLCSRFGGEEFALVLEKTDGETALRIAERLRMEVEKSRFVVEGDRIPLRLSAGVAAYPELHVKAGKDLLLLADEALIEAKKRGRNRSLLHQGRGRFRTIGGKILTDKKARREPEAPTLFA